MSEEGGFAAAASRSVSAAAAGGASSFVSSTAWRVDCDALGPVGGRGGPAAASAEGNAWSEDGSGSSR